ncbi:NUDIX hydrolase [Klebsiella sp. BIGb0407]|uniref:NUDIX hydrolase n=1 Tax=Klebsiella sp. BIGb0407 TaxID=2940603 RepID=UPI0021674D61|nr:NUDIX hydrolase [Klebsiella sp. BIGb0407]MCS3434029.1 ADP-ribose pyrophosphatase YjhB (NUDIX family) [Klebsiella sp. BIGb0407]
MLSNKNKLIIQVVIFIFLMFFLYMKLSEGDFSNATVAVLIAAMVYLWSYPNHLNYLVYFSSRASFNRKIITSFKAYNKEKDFQDLLVQLNIAVKKYFNKVGLTRDFIEISSPIECAALLLAMQGEKNPFTIQPNLTVSDFRNISCKAAKYNLYRSALLSSSLNNLNYNVKDNLSTIDDTTYQVADDLKKYSDDNFNKALQTTENDEMIVFSTTSQVSSDIINLLRHNNTNIKKISFFICSPFVKTDSAISNMFTEYRNPFFATPVGQFIINSDGEVDEKLDVIRRVMKIISSISSLVELSRTGGVEVNVNVFRDFYPGVKIKILKNKKFMQIQPGNLTYANNLYRFGVEVESSSLFDDVMQSINSYTSLNEKVQRLSLNENELVDFKNKALSELSLWLLEQKVLPEELLANKNRLTTSIDDAQASEWIDSIVESICYSRYCSKIPLNKTVKDSIESFSAHYDSSNTAGIYIGSNEYKNQYHITVAAMFINEDKILLIKKSDSAYNHRFSIVAGHLENGENPDDAIVREVKEELGIDFCNYEYLKKECGVEDRCRHGLALHDWYIYLSNEFIDIEVLKFDRTEIESLEWISLSEIESVKDNLTEGAYLIFKRLGYIHE